jgi:hypothetical protein
MLLMMYHAYFLLSTSNIGEIKYCVNGRMLEKISSTFCLFIQSLVLCYRVTRIYVENCNLFTDFIALSICVIRKESYYLDM